MSPLFVFCADSRFWPDSARTNIPRAKIAATQKINRAALDIFILLILFHTSLPEWFVIESQVELCGSVGAILRRRPQGRQAESLERTRYGTNLRRKNGNKTVTIHGRSPLIDLRPPNTTATTTRAVRAWDAAVVWA